MKKVLLALRSQHLDWPARKTTLSLLKVTQE